MSAEAHSPLAQFEIHPLIPIQFQGLDLSYTNSAFWMTLAIAGLLIFMVLGGRKRALVPSRLQGLNEMMVEFMQNTVRETAGADALKYFPLVFTLFAFILFCNLFGLIPYSFTPTSHIAVTLLMAACVFIGVTLLAIFKHGPIHFLGSFIPEGTPLVMMPVMFVLELLSYMVRPLSLSLRLAINMTAGHILLKIFAMLIITFGVVGLFTMFPLLVAMIAFELLVAVLQAYIFAVLTCVYLGQALHLH